MSMREKSLERRRVTKEHNSNFRAGHVFVNENQLYKTGLRGRKRFVFYLILLVLYIIVLTNLLVLLLIVFSLRINDDGMVFMEVVPDTATRFLHQVYMNRLSLNGTSNGQIASFQAQNLALFGEKFDLQSQHNPTNAHICIGAKRTEVYSSSFEIVSPITSKTIFPSDHHEFQLTNVNKISFGLVNTSTVSSGSGQDLLVTSAGDTNITAGEDIHIQSYKLQWNASTCLRLLAKNLKLENSNGLYIPELSADENGVETSLKSKLCIDAESHKLFRSFPNISCADDSVH